MTTPDVVEKIGADRTAERARGTSSKEAVTPGFLMYVLGAVSVLTYI